MTPSSLMYSATIRWRMPSSKLISGEIDARGFANSAAGPSGPRLQPSHSTSRLACLGPRWIDAESHALLMSEGAVEAFGLGLGPEVEPLGPRLGKGFGDQ